MHKQDSEATLFGTIQNNDRHVSLSQIRRGLLRN